MTKRSVLVVTTADDLITRMRHAHIAKDPFLDSFEIAYYYVLVVDEASFREPYSLSHLQYLGREDLFEGLQRKVNESSPDAIVIHNGLAYHRHGNDIRWAIDKILQSNPIEVAVEGSKDSGAEVAELIAHLF